MFIYLDTAYMICHCWVDNLKLNCILVLFAISQSICILPVESVTHGASVPDRAI